MILQHISPNLSIFKTKTCKIKPNQSEYFPSNFRKEFCSFLYFNLQNILLKIPSDKTKSIPIVTCYNVNNR